MIFSKKVNKFTLLLILIKSLVLVMCLTFSAAALVPPGISMLPLELPDTDGNIHSLSGIIKDKVALIVYWSISCPRCREQMPQLQTIAKRFEGNPFQFIFINSDGYSMRRAVANYAIEYLLPGPWLIDIGPNDTIPFADYFDIIATPGILVFNKLGKMTQAQELQIDMIQLSQSIENSF